MCFVTVASDMEAANAAARAAHVSVCRAPPGSVDDPTQCTPRVVVVDVLSVAPPRQRVLDGGDDVRELPPLVAARQLIALQRRDLQVRRRVAGARRPHSLGVAGSASCNDARRGQTSSRWRFKALWSCAPTRRTREKNGRLTFPLVQLLQVNAGPLAICQVRRAAGWLARARARFSL